MDWPLFILLIPYLFVLFVGSLMLFFNLYHLAKFGLEGGKTLGIMTAYVLAFVLCALVGIEALIVTDWTGTFGPQDIFPFLTF